MRSEVARQILAETPKELEIFVRLYADITVRINQLLKEKGLSQKDLAEAMNKKPSEISKWLSGEHNFTLRSLAKLQAELNEEIICIPKQKVFTDAKQHQTTMTVFRNPKKNISATGFEAYKIKPDNQITHAS